MSNSIDIIPSILTDDPDVLADMLHRADTVVDRVHIDIIDGVYADNETIDPTALNMIDNGLMLDFHLMVNEPENWVQKCLRAGGDRIIGQLEMMESQRKFIEAVTSEGASVGIAIDDDSDIDDLDSDYLDSLDVIVVMSVPAGFGGQEFRLSALEKIDKLDRLRKEKGYRYAIADDGGITLDLIDDVRREGADEAIIGNRIFNGDLKANIENFLKNA